MISPRKISLPQDAFRPIWAEIDHGGLRRNFAALSRLLPKRTGILSVVKANAYGHGLLPVAKTLVRAGSRFLGVASIEEGILLRRAGVGVPILILGNIYPFENLLPVIENRLRVTVASQESARQCSAYAKRAGKKIYAHAKIDTGMSRIGVNVRNALAFVKALSVLPSVELEGIFTHFADSAQDSEFTRRQLSLFKELLRDLAAAGVRIPFVHCANSAGLLKYPGSRLSLVRPGLSLYGINPLPRPAPLPLSPVLSWKSRIVFLKTVPKGTPVSYASTFVCRRRSRIATAAFGYADGYRRSLSNRGQVLVRGRRVPVVGRVTMDMTMLDVTDLPEVSVGDEVVMIGWQGKESIGAAELGGWMGTSPYEVLVDIAARVPRIHLGAQR